MIKEKTYSGQLYEIAGNSGFLRCENSDDCEKMIIVKDILRATKNVTTFNPNMIESIYSQWHRDGEISLKQYNALVKIYYDWHIENKLANIYKTMKVEEIE